MLRLGLTGGIASGKSTVGQMLHEAGAIVLDADAIVHGLLAKDGSAYDQVVEAFGPSILAPDLSIDRRLLGEIVFADESARLRLNELIHPLVRQTLKAKEDDYRALEQTQGKSWLLVMMIPLLYESNLAHYVDQTVLVYCPADQQLARLMERNGFSREQALARIGAQLPIEAKVELADEVIDNSRDLDWTRQEVQRVLGEFTWDRYDPPSLPAS
ncbi:MAG: dephospho-CoA kinase [Candidatus Melainabacteria bacterium HGW-Melainabacteria-1]|nr:MAG: dephospho-CoA kinase [Candidatus Melainabacteria bacterium HGW-Melainabacteria-1]